ncbi:ribonuclease H2, subunit C [Mucidula mucida]|nr:ribonuclease H2, subunit C [Mucidula mucida]
MAISKALPTRTPDLMPFHISYNGPAPVSTFMRVEERQTENLDVSASDVNALPPSESCVPQNASTNSHDKPPSQSKMNVLRRAASYLISTFRGRTIHGTRVQLPMGYVGIVFQGGEEDRNRGKEKKPSKAQPKVDVDTPRRTRRSTQKDVEEIMVSDEEEGEKMDVDEPESRNLLLELTAVSTFPSFNLWLPDNLARERDDEYVRTLKEWVPLSELIHWIPPPSEQKEECHMGVPPPQSGT